MNENKNEAEAYYSKGMQYRYGYDGVVVDNTKALDYYHKAADLGYKAAYMALWSSYYMGEGVDVNYKAAYKWCRKSAEEGDFVAAYYLGCMLAKGEGVEQDYMEAYIWFLTYTRGYKLDEHSVNKMENNKVYELLSDEQKELVSKEATIRYKRIKEKLTSDK